MKALLIIAEEGYQDKEYGAPKRILEEAGIEVITGSKKIGICRGSFVGTAEATISLNEIDVSKYDAVIFIGGPGARQYQKDVQAHLIAQEALNQNKILAAICIAPTILAYAGVLNGRKATVYNKDGKSYKILEKNGAIFVDEDVVVDGKIVTASGPPAAEKFGRKIVELLKNEN